MPASLTKHGVGGKSLGQISRRFRTSKCSPRYESCKTVLTNKRYSPILVSVIPLLANIGGIHRYLAILANITVFLNLAIVRPGRRGNRIAAFLLQRMSPLLADFVAEVRCRLFGQ